MIAIAPEARPKRGALPQKDLRVFLEQAREAIPLHGEVSVLLTTDAQVQELNRSFRRKNKPTDVLSFPAAQDFGGSEAYAGDLAISLDTSARQAEEFGHSLQLEVKVLLLHGLLHLAGYDHETDSGQMARKERALRKRFDLPLGLIQRAGADAIPTAQKTAVKKTATKKSPAKKTAAKKSVKKAVRGSAR